ncbi:MAG: hypothetical protein A2Z29_09450 [Chloroflexi bacterium RBG_16_56_11]|nr:MAG: hypothetical protein A2Z29_09450 [Chloroflexi bacterium RBG_16_56_11]
MTNNDVPVYNPVTPGTGASTGGDGPRQPHLSYTERLSELASRRYRNPALHWTAFGLSLASLVLLLVWVSGSRATVPALWVWLDVGMAIIFALEFLTRSGFRWDPTGYVVTHIFDFIAIAPAIVIIYYQLPLSGFWIWLILVGRIIRAIDRLLGDGFVRRNILAIIEGFEEEITDRVLLRIMARIRADIGRGSLSAGLAEVLARNKESVLQRVRAQHPQEGIIASVARVSGLDNVLEKAEERTYDSVVEIIKSPEIDHTIREAIDSAFSAIQSELDVRSWRQNLGLGRGHKTNRETGQS